ncbi:MAG TPA: CoA transferase [Acidimicrobiales bacterium]
MRPLSDVNVIEASSYVSGPIASLNLADLGANVLKVEPPRGDPMRNFGVRHEGISLSFAACNVGKDSVTLDLKNLDDQKHFHELLASTDVLITNWRPQVAEGLGLNGRNVTEMYPRLIWVRISGFGQDGPLADRPAFDSIIQARTGVALAREGDASLVPGYLADKATGILAAQAVLAALHQRHVTKNAAVLDVAMLDAMAYFNGPDIFAGGIRTGEYVPDVMRHIGSPRPIATKDGWIVLSPVSGSQLKALMVAVGHPEWTDVLRGVEATELIAEMNRVLDTVLFERTSLEWEEIFTNADVPASALLTVEQHFEDAQVIHNRLYDELDDPILGRIRRLRHPALFNGEPIERDDRAVPELST